MTAPLTTKTRSQQRIEQLVNAGRALTQAESDELYRALHADYMRKWRLAKAENEVCRHDLAISKLEEASLLAKLRQERAA